VQPSSQLQAAGPIGREDKGLQGQVRRVV